MIFSDLLADQFNFTLFSKNVVHTAVSLVFCKTRIHPIRINFIFMLGSAGVNWPKMTLECYRVPKYARKLGENQQFRTQTPGLTVTLAEVLTKLALFELNSILSAKKIYFW